MGRQLAQVGKIIQRHVIQELVGVSRGGRRRRFLLAHLPFGNAPARLLNTHRRRPDQPVQQRRAADIQHPFIKVRPRDEWRDRLQPRRVFQSRHPLRSAEIRSAKGPHDAIRPRLGGDPGDGIRPILPLLEHHIPLPFRGKTPARVLNNDHVAGLHHAQQVERIIAGDDPVFIVGRAGQNGRLRRSAVQTVNIGGKFHPIAHRRHHVFFNQDSFHKTAFLS